MLRYIHMPEKDCRISRGDDFAGDAWLDRSTGDIVYSAVGCEGKELSLKVWQAQGELNKWLSEKETHNEQSR